MLDFGHPVTFNEFVGDTDENGQRVDRQFRYYPHAEPKPVLVTDGGVGGSEEAMQEESIQMPEGGIAITEDTEHELLRFYWQATAKYREHHDAVARGEKEPANTPDGNPPREEMRSEVSHHDDRDQTTSSDALPPNMNGNHFTQPGQQQVIPPIQETPTPEPAPPGLPTVEVDLPTFTQMQRQLVVSESLVDHQDMVIQSQCILLAKLLDPDSPHHEIMEMWMDKLEAMRLKVYGDPGITGNPETAD